MGSFSIWHWIIVLLVISLIFGTNKIKSIGHDLGEAIKNFKNALSHDKNDSSPKS